MSELSELHDKAMTECWESINDWLLSDIHETQFLKNHNKKK